MLADAGYVVVLSLLRVAAMSFSGLLVAANLP